MEQEKKILDPRLKELINQFSGMDTVDIEWIIENSPGVTEEAVKMLAQEVFAKGVDAAHEQVDEMVTKGEVSSQQNIIPHHMVEFDLNNDGEIDYFEKQAYLKHKEEEEKANREAVETMGKINLSGVIASSISKIFNLGNIKPNKTPENSIEKDLEK